MDFVLCVPEKHYMWNFWALKKVNIGKQDNGYEQNFWSGFDVLTNFGYFENLKFFTYNGFLGHIVFFIFFALFFV